MIKSVETSRQFVSFLKSSCDTWIVFTVHVSSWQMILSFNDVRKMFNVYLNGAPANLSVKRTKRITLTKSIDIWQSSWAVFGTFADGRT